MWGFEGAGNGWEYNRSGPTAAPSRLTRPPRDTSGGSGRIRPLRADDLPDIVALRRRSFNSGQRTDPVDLAGYCERVFLRNPWRDEELSSLVYENAAGQPMGFIGVIPRRMVFQGQPIRVAVATQMMVAPEARGLAGLQLVRKLLSGPQDLTLSDTANDTARRVWTTVGADEILLYGFSWERVLRPWRSLRWQVADKHLALRAAAYAAGPFLVAGDMIAKQFPAYHIPRPAGTLGRLDAETITTHADRLMQDRVLRPAYDVQSLGWLLAEAAEKKEFGSLGGGIVRSVDGEIAGWFAHYTAKRKVSQVVLFAARRATQALVMDHLLYDVARLGAIAISGRLDPALLPMLPAPVHCLRYQAPWTLAYSRRPEILRALEKGDAFFSRLDGEWWLSF